MVNFNVQLLYLFISHGKQQDTFECEK